MEFQRIVFLHKNGQKTAFEFESSSSLDTYNQVLERVRKTPSLEKTYVMNQSLDCPVMFNVEVENQTGSKSVYSVATIKGVFDFLLGERFNIEKEKLVQIYCANQIDFIGRTSDFLARFAG